MIDIEFIITRISKDRSIELFELCSKASAGSVIWFDSQDEMNFIGEIMRNARNGKQSACLNIA